MLWVKVIKEIYGVDGGFDQQENRGSQAQPWARIIKLHSSLVAKGIDISGRLSKRVGNGSDTRFWEENWIAGNTLSSLYPRLYALELNPVLPDVAGIDGGDIDTARDTDMKGNLLDVAKPAE
ncbi:hypothetical protein Tco_1430255 [Tanacetum coccineum]